MHKRSFSFIELVMAMALMALIASTAIIYYEDYMKQGLESTTEQDLDVLKKAVETYQIQNKRLYARHGPPSRGLLDIGGSSKDYWGNDYIISPAQSLIYSPGPNCIDDKGLGDDIGITFDTMPGGGLTAPIQLKITIQGPPLHMTWKNAPGMSVQLKGFKIESRIGSSSQWEDALSGRLIPPTVFTCSISKPDGAITYYRVRAVDITGQESPPSNQVGWMQPRSSAPELIVDPQNITITSGSQVTFTVIVKSFGCTLRELEFDRERKELTGTSARLRFVRTFDKSEDFKVSVYDTHDVRTRISVSVRVN